MLGEINPVDICDGSFTFIDFPGNNLQLYPDGSRLWRRAPMKAPCAVPVIPDPSRGNVFSAFGKWNGKQWVSILIDTGASHSLICSSVVGDSGSGPKITLSDFEGHTADAVFSSGGRLETGDIVFQLETALSVRARLKHQIILGMDVLARYKILLPPRRGRLVLFAK